MDGHLGVETPESLHRAINIVQFRVGQRDKYWKVLYLWLKLLNDGNSRMLDAQPYSS